MAAVCGDVGKEIVKEDYGISKEMAKKCEGVNKREATDYEYIDKKFGFSRVLWVIKNSCITAPLGAKIFCSYEFYVRGRHLTRWVMSLERCKEDDTDAFLYLKRLECEPFYGNVVADCFLEFSDHHGEQLIEEIHQTFGVNVNNQVRKLVKYAGISVIKDFHISEFKLKLEILVYFEDLKESILPCSDLGVRRLGEDLRELYDDGVITDLELKLQSNSQLKVHKSVLFSRITNTDITKLIASDAIEIDFQDYDAENAEKVIKFLYTSDLNYTVVSNPSIAVFKFAELLDVKPIIAYYNPEEIMVISSIDIEEFSASWTIEEFCSRDDYFLQSPVMTNKMMDTKWQITVYPKGFRNESKYLDMFLVYETTKSKFICAELFLQAGPESRISYRCHKQINYEEKEKAFESFKLDEVLNNYMRDSSLTIYLQLRMSTGQANPPVCNESKINCKYLSEQKYYDRLSDDILWLRQSETLSNCRIDLDHHNITFNVHECILFARCRTFFDELKKYQGFNDTSVASIFGITYFAYSGKLDERSSLSDTFDLYRAAENFSYEHLKTIIIGKLEKILSRLNAERIHEFAVEQRIQNLEYSARRFLPLQ